jgi:hypothetical protein
MAQTAAQRKQAHHQRDRLRLGDFEYKRIVRDKMRANRASKRPPKPKTTIIINNQPPLPPPPSPQANKPSKQKSKAPPQQRTPQFM